jgi:hypothetical protein
MKIRKLKDIVNTDPDFQLDRNDKYKVKFVHMVSEVPHVLSTRKVKKFQSSVSEKGMTFTLDWNQPAYRQKNTFFYMIDIEKGQLLINARDEQKVVSPEATHMVIKRSGIRQLVMSMEKRKMGEIILYVILGVIAGVLGGYILGNVLPMV